MPNYPIRTIGVDMYREMRTLAEVLDLMLKGKNMQACDMVMARFKACQQRVKDGNWNAAKWYELIPADDSHLAFNADEEDTVHSIQLREARARALVSKANA